MSVVSAGTRPSLPDEERWLVSRRFDLLFIIFSSGLLIVPHLFANGGVSNVVVDLIVTALIGGPHLFATYTMTFMEPRFRQRYPLYTWSSLLMPVVVVTLAIINLTLLVTIFFFWASVHVIHQALYIADSYRNKDSRWSQQTLTRWRRLSRLIDYGLLFTSIYPIATFKFTGTPLHLGPIHVVSDGFKTGGRELLFPAFLKVDWLPYLVTAAFLTLLVVFIVKTLWELRSGLFHGPKTLHMSVAAALFFATPFLPNLDVAFEGLNVWHSFQYLAVVLYLNRLRTQRGLVGSEFVANLSRSGPRLYLLCFAFTLGAAVAYLLLRGGLMLFGAFADDPAQLHYFTFYTVVLSALLIHYYFDHFLFLQVDDVITPQWRR